jgi:nitrogenase molybdenum-iron protein NifN
MTTLVGRHKALAVSPLKSSQPMGGALAFLGMQRALPMLHGSQGCTAFAKVFLVRHFREPIPLQTTAMDQVSTVMGADENVVEGLRAVCAKSRPALVGLLTTGLSETQGADVRRALKEFRRAYPELGAIPVVPVSTPDYVGCLESGFAAAVAAMIDELVPPAAESGTRPGRNPRQVNVLAGAMLTPGDIEALKDLVEAFGLQPVVLPDLSDSLDGHLTPEDFSPLTLGGTPVGAFAGLGDAAATLVIGASLAEAADRLHARTGVPDHRFDGLMGLEAVDRLVLALHAISGMPVPARIERQRAQLQDAMVDTHFMLGQARVAVAGDPDLLLAFGRLVCEMGGELVAAVASARAPALERVPADEVKIGDLEDLEQTARERRAQVVVGSSHAAPCAERLGLPLLRAGFPQYDYLGGYQRCWIGYRGTRQALFDLANLLLAHGHHGIAPYRSIYAQRPEPSIDAEDPTRAPTTPAARGDARH